MASSKLEVENTPLEPWHKVDGKVVMVTGASSGIGRDICLNLAAGGCRIIAAARRMERLRALCEEINKNSSDFIRAVPLELDVTADGVAIEAAVHKAWEAFGHVDALVNNAGIRGKIKSSLEVTEDEWNETIKTNYTGQWLTAKYIGRRMRDSGRGGSIINVSSMGGLNRVLLPGGVAYNSSKAALDLVTKAMAIELGQYNIRVNSIAPGLFRSEITESLLKMQFLVKVMARTVPLQVTGDTDPAITSLVRYLIHESSTYISGNIFIVDGGATLPGYPIFSSL